METQFNVRPRIPAGDPGLLFAPPISRVDPLASLPEYRGRSSDENPLQILHLEDDFADAELAHQEIRVGDLAHEITVVKSRDEYLAAVKRKRFDVILSDFSLPGFDGADALSIARSECPDVPFIFCTGSIGEGRATQLLKNGATDYVLKDRMSGLPAAIRRAVREASERRQRFKAEESLRESEQFFRAVAGSLGEGLVICDLLGRIVFANPRALEIMGKSTETLGTAFADLPLPKDLLPEAYAGTAGNGPGVSEMIDGYEHAIDRPDATPIWVEIHCGPLRNAAGDVIGRLIKLNDVTKRKRAEGALREAEVRFRGIFENAVEGIIQTTPDGRILMANPAFAVMLGYESAEDLLAASLSMGRDVYMNPQVRADYLRKMEDLDICRDFECQVKRRDGKVIWISINARPSRDPSGRIQCYDATCMEITERKRVEQRHAVEQAVISTLAEAKPLPETVKNILKLICRELKWDLGALWRVDRSANVLRCIEICYPPSTEFLEFVNLSRQTTFARGEGLPGFVWASREPKWVADTRQEQGVSKVRRASGIGLNTAFAFPVRLGDDVVGVIEFFSAQIREPDAELLAMFNSVGSQIGQFIDRRNLENQLRHAQKMDAIGTLAGGIAHDFNNILAAINGYTELAKMDCSDNPGVLKHLNAVAQGGQRAADLVRQILAFSRQEEKLRKPIQLRHIVAEAINLLRATTPATINFKTVLARDVATVLADATQIHQIVMNLGTNAWHAMKDRPGTLEVKLEDFEADEEFGHRNPGMRPGRVVHLSVRDTGKGMDKATLDRIFEPFFTTKGPGEGTGLGLSVVHGIVQDHDGRISVESQPGEGTTFHLYFPAHESEAPDARKHSLSVPRGNGERILLVDDEKPLVELGRMMLDRLGYQVETQTSVALALAAVRDNPRRFDLVITDLTMREMTGLELAKYLLQIRPDLPIILNTGYSASLTPESVREMGIRELLLKPLDLETVGTAVHRVLAGGKAG